MLSTLQLKPGVKPLVPTVSPTFLTMAEPNLSLRLSLVKYAALSIFRMEVAGSK